MKKCNGHETTYCVLTPSTKQYNSRVYTYTRIRGSVLSRITRPPDLDVRGISRSTILWILNMENVRWESFEFIVLWS